MKIQNGIQPAVNKVDTTQIDQQKIKKIAVQFESLLMNTMLKTMRSTIQSSGLIDNEGEIKHYREMLDTEYSNALATTDVTCTCALQLYLVRTYVSSG